MGHWEESIRKYPKLLHRYPMNFPKDRRFSLQAKPWTPCILPHLACRCNADVPRVLGNSGSFNPRIPRWPAPSSPLRPLPALTVWRCKTARFRGFRPFVTRQWVGMPNAAWFGAALHGVRRPANGVDTKLAGRHGGWRRHTTGRISIVFQGSL